MTLDEALRVAVRGLVANKLRTSLTMLGIIIGVAAVIILVSVGQGFTLYVTHQFQSLGSNLVFIVPGNPSSTRPNIAGPRRLGTLTLNDEQAIANPLNVPDAAGVTAELNSNFADIRYSNQEIHSLVDGAMPNYPTIRNSPVVAGRFIDQQDMDMRSRVAVLGQAVLTKLFGDNALPLGKTITVNNIPFQVIGIMEAKGGSSFGGGANQDNVVYVPLTTAATRLFQARNAQGQIEVSVISVQASSENAITDVENEVTQLLRVRHKITFSQDDDFTVMSQQDFLSVFGNILGTLTLVLGAIAGISLIVGGIGIMNIMLVSVTERTREIGIRKAVGAKRRDVLLQFLIESIVISLAGGVMGMLLGYAGSDAVGKLVSGLHPVVTPGAIALATGFSAAVGLFFGIYPATRAAQLSPMEALRYE
jgi:putative ABC transport system permease protein